MKNETPSGKTRDKSKKHRAILKAAVQAYRETGYYSSSMDRIAEIAQVSKVTIYNHFPGKDQLFKAVVTDYLEKHMKLKGKIRFDSRSLKEQLQEFADSEIWLVNSRERAGLAKVLTEVFLRQPQLAMEARAICKSPQEPLRNWLMEAQKAGLLAVPDPEFAAGFFYSMVEGAITWPALFADLPDNDKLSFMKEEIIGVFLGRYAARKVK